VLTSRTDFTRQYRASTPRKRRKVEVSVPVPRGYSKVLATLERPLADRLARLASKLLILTGMTKERRNRKRHFIPFGRNAWVGMFGSDYAYPVASAAESTGLIERNHKYSNSDDSKFPKSVRLSRKYHRRVRSGGVEEWTLDQKPRSKKTDRKTARKSELIDWLESKLPLFDIGAVGSFKPHNAWDALMGDAIRRREYYAVQCDFGRLHTNFTACSKSTMQTLSCKSQESMITIDIKNSQPLILGIVQKYNQHTDKTNPVPICVPLSARREITHWTEFCQDGVIYETLLSLLMKMNPSPYWQQIRKQWVQADPSTWTRSDIKKQFLIVLFARWEDTRENPLYRVMELHFPGMAAFVRSVKEGGKYQQLAQMCQRTESTLMIQQVCGRLMRECPEIPILTRHDALVVPESYRGIAVSVIRSVYAGVGLTPSMEIVSYGLAKS
jgi:hypothetical protein